MPVDRVEVRALDLIRPAALRRRGEARWGRGHLLVFSLSRGVGARCERELQLSACLRRLCERGSDVVL